MVAAVSQGRMASRLRPGAGAARRRPTATSCAMQLGTALVTRGSTTVIDYAVRMVAATREWPGIALGAGPRGSIALVRAARAQAVLAGRDFVTPDDVREIAKPALAPSHRAGAGTADRRPVAGRRAARAAGQGGSAAPVRPCTAPAVRRCSRWALVGALASASLVPSLAWTLVGGALLCVLLVDGWRVASSRGAGHRAPCARCAGRSASNATCTLQLDNGGAPLRMDVHDLHPGHGPRRACRARSTLQPGTSATFAYSLRADRARRLHVSKACSCACIRRGGCGGSRASPATRAAVRVFPNFAPLTRLCDVQRRTGLAPGRRAPQAPPRRRHRLPPDARVPRRRQPAPDRLEGDLARAPPDLARIPGREEPATRAVLDTGRRMLARDGELAHFDHVLDAALVVSYLALRQGDAVGLLASGGDQRWVAAATRHGRDRHPAARDLRRCSRSAVATDYPAAATELALRQRRRALVMLVTNLRDEDIDDLLAAVQHAAASATWSCVASLREDALDAALAARRARPAAAHPRRRHRALPRPAQRRARCAAQPACAWCST